MHVGIDAHKRSCTVCVVEEGAVRDSFSFPTTREGVREFMEKVRGKATVVIEASTTGKVLSRMLLERYEVHMVAPPERKRSIKTDRRDAERIAREDMLQYVRRCYIPSPYIEEYIHELTHTLEGDIAILEKYPEDFDEDSWGNLAKESEKD